MKIRIVYKVESTTDKTDPGYYTTIETKIVTIDDATYGYMKARPNFKQFKVEVIARNLFTGAYDRSGNEIYEGDICCHVLEENDAGFMLPVEFKKGCFTCAGIPLYEWIDEDGNSILEVVGNIYEEGEK